jgi:hypothetical protein
MGTVDCYPHPYPTLPPHVGGYLEPDAISWRGRTRGLSRVHGDSHPRSLRCPRRRLPGVRETWLGLARALMAGGPLVPEDRPARPGGRS